MAGPFAFSFLSLAFVCFSVHVCTHAHTSGYTCATAHEWKHRTMWRSWVSLLQHRDQGSNSDYRAWWQRLCLRGHLVTLSSFSLIFFFFTLVSLEMGSYCAAQAGLKTLSSCLNPSTGTVGEQSG